MLIFLLRLFSYLSFLGGLLLAGYYAPAFSELKDPELVNVVRSLGLSLVCAFGGIVLALSLRATGEIVRYLRIIARRHAE